MERHENANRRTASAHRCHCPYLASSKSPSASVARTWRPVPHTQRTGSNNPARNPPARPAVPPCRCPRERSPQSPCPTRRPATAVLDSTRGIRTDECLVGKSANLRRSSWRRESRVYGRRREPTARDGPPEDIRVRDMYNGLHSRGR